MAMNTFSDTIDKSERDFFVSSKNSCRESMVDNLILIDPRSHLEVADFKHRYAKNLRFYFQEYARVIGGLNILSIAVNTHGEGHEKDVASSSSSIQNNETSLVSCESGSGTTTVSSGSLKEGVVDEWCQYRDFFRWLDGGEKPELASCPRSVLDSDTVLYITNEEDRLEYAVQIDHQGLFRPLLRPSETITTGDSGWIFVTKGDILYAYYKKTESRPRIHHSTFLAGASVEAAGLFVASEGRLVRLFPHSGHYRPAECHLRCLLQFLHDHQVNHHHHTDHRDHPPTSCLLFTRWTHRLRWTLLT